MTIIISVNIYASANIPSHLFKLRIIIRTHTADENLCYQQPRRNKPDILYHSVLDWTTDRPIKFCLVIRIQIFKQESALCISLVYIIKILHAVGHCATYS
jgi:hypothetical protein